MAKKYDYTELEQSIVVPVGNLKRQEKQMTITEMKVNGIVSPVGYQFNPLSFSWKVEDLPEDEEPDTARIVIYQENDRGKPERTGEDSMVLYDSGFSRDLDSCGTGVECPLKPGTGYRWTVQACGTKGSRTEGKGRFETGKMDEPWKAKWITSGDPDTPAVLRKKFYVSAPGSEDRLYILGLGLYEAYLNGQKVGNEYLAPGYHSYDCHLQYQTYDVGEILYEGENELTVYLGDGWYRGRLGFSGGYTNLYGKENILLAELYRDGTLLAATDASWEWHPSPAVFSNIYDGEIFDARVIGELENGWKPVQLCNRTPTVPLSDRYSLPIVPKEQFTVKEIIHTPKGETVLDFGQELTGWVVFHMPSAGEGGLAKGEAIRLTASEILQDGCFFHGNYRTARAEFTYIADGNARRVRPHHTVYCFRYVKIEKIPQPVIAKDVLQVKNPPEGIPAENKVRFVKGDAQGLSDEELQSLMLTAVHLRSDFDSISRISTGIEAVNQLISNATWGQKDNFLDVPTDCPQRDERLGWTGDAQVFSETACLNMDTAAFYRKYLWDMRAEQELADGAVPNVVPGLKAGLVDSSGITPWANAGGVIPWNVYRIYGNREMLRESYPGMKAWVDYEYRKDEERGGSRLNQDEFGFGDWLALDNPKPGPIGATDSRYIASAYYYQDALHTAEAARILEYDKDAEKLEALSEEIHKAILEKYFDAEGICLQKTQTAAAIAIVFGLNPSQEAAKKQGDVLAELIHTNHDHLNTGFIGTPVLCQALSLTGHHDLAVTLLLNDDLPSWLYSVKMGATTIWERWNSVEEDGKLNPEGMNSLNHYSYGSILGWMYQYLAGITPEAPGFSEAVICPRPDPRIGKVHCEMNTVSGKYISNWAYDESGIVRYHIEIPASGRGKVVIGERIFELRQGKYDFR